MPSIIHFVRRGYTLLVRGASSLQSVFLLVVRLYWGWQFFGTGKGKLQNLEKITGFFQDLGIPLPMAKRTRDEFFPRAAIDPDKLTGLDVIVQDAVTLKYTATQLTKEQLAELIQIPPRK